MAEARAIAAGPKAALFECTQPEHRTAVCLAVYTTMANISERDPLLGPPGETNLARDIDISDHKRAAQHRGNLTRAVVHGVLTTAFVAALLCMIFSWDKISGYAGALPKDPAKAAQRVLESSPVIVRLHMQS